MIQHTREIVFAVLWALYLVTIAVAYVVLRLRTQNRSGLQKLRGRNLELTATTYGLRRRRAWWIIGESDVSLRQRMIDAITISDRSACDRERDHQQKSLDGVESDGQNRDTEP